MDQLHKQRRQLESLERDALSELQLQRLNKLLETVLPENRFYAGKLGGEAVRLESLDQLAELPFTEKSELVGEDDFAVNLTYPVERYARFHRTSGTHGRPLVVLDTADDWQWWIDTWQFVLDAAELTSVDRVVMAFSFGPFIGFWSAHDAAVHRGCLVVPSGGLSTVARIELIRSVQATALFCTPTYALHMAEVAEAKQIDVSQTDVRRIVVAGEPGGSIPSVRERIETAWNAQVTDHSGASEVGPWGYADADREGLHVNESEFIAEFIAVESGRPAKEGELSELVLTTLGRYGMPVIRYRTGDLVRPSWQARGNCRFVYLDGGVLSRADDMMIIRGVNVFPSSVEQIIRSFPEVVEYQMTAFKDGAMDALSIEVEDRLQQPERIANELQLKLGLRVDIQCVPAGSLPRFEAKGKRFVDQRKP